MSEQDKIKVEIEISKGDRRDCPTLRKISGDGEIELVRKPVPNPTANYPHKILVTCPYFDQYYDPSRKCGILGDQRRVSCPYSEL